MQNRERLRLAGRVLYLVDGEQRFPTGPVL